MEWLPAPGLCKDAVRGMPGVRPVHPALPCCSRRRRPRFPSGAGLAGRGSRAACCGCGRRPGDPGDGTRRPPAGPAGGAGREVTVLVELLADRGRAPDVGLERREVGRRRRGRAAEDPFQDPLPPQDRRGGGAVGRDLQDGRVGDHAAAPGAQRQRRPAQFPRIHPRNPVMPGQPPIEEAPAAPDELRHARLGERIAAFQPGQRELHEGGRGLPVHRTAEGGRQERPQEAGRIGRGVGRPGIPPPGRAEGCRRGAGNRRTRRGALPSPPSPPPTRVP